MLVLTRKLNETIQIGDHVTVTLLRVKGSTVRLGIDAPHDVRIVRGELEPHDAPSDAPPAARPYDGGPDANLAAGDGSDVTPLRHLSMAL